MKKGRGTSKNIKNGVQAAILYVKTMHKDWSPARIGNYLKTHRDKFNLDISEIPVSRTIYNVIERKQTALANMQDVVNSETFKELEDPWHMGTMKKAKFFIQPEIIPDILAVQSWGNNHLDDFKRKRKPLTIRQALWVARLYGIACLFRQGIRKNKNKKMDLQGWLWQWAEAYAQYEVICELSKIPFDTTKLDAAMWEGKWPISASNAILLFSTKDNTMDYVGEIKDEGMMKNEA